MAWIIGWDLILEYLFGAATVAAGWSGYVNSFLKDVGIVLPPSLTNPPGALVQRFRQSQGRPLKALLEQVLPPDTPGRARAIVDAAAEVVAVGGHGRDLAKALQLSRRTLLRWCERAELPPPRKLLAWMRILLACELLDDPGRTVLSVAHACGYSSDSGLRRVTQKFVGSSPTELRRRGAFARASKVFLEALSKYRGATAM
jgi:AraC-like DNA-binding protein